jgi:hypothetical protein
MLGVKRFVLDLKHSHTITLRWYKSDDRGTNWNQIGEEASIAAPAATDTTTRDFFVEPYADWKLDLINGGSAQTTFEIDMVMTDERGGAA